MKILICTGYAMVGAAAMFVMLGLVAALMSANYFVGGYLLAWGGFAVTENSKAGLMTMLFLAEIGAFLGAMVCKDRR